MKTAPAKLTCMVVDIGNTRATLGVVRAGRVLRRGAVLTRVRDERLLRRALRALTRGLALDGSALGSVVPAASAVWRRALAAECGGRPVVVSCRIPLGVGVDYPHPETIGADRLCNASGAIAKYRLPIIVADFGTALTFDIVSRAGDYVGGVIAPGLPMMADYLAERTALLPRIRIPGACARIGRSTRGAMRIGARIGYRGMVREITAHLRAGLRARRVTLVATGGYAGWAIRGLELPYVLDRDLTLFGLARIFALNHPSTRSEGDSQDG